MDSSESPVRFPGNPQWLVGCGISHALGQIYSNCTMKTFPFTFLAFTGWLVTVALGGIFLGPDAGSGAQEDPALPILEATNSALTREAGRLYLGSVLVTGIVLDRTDESTTWTPYQNGLRHGREVSRYSDGSLKLDRRWDEGHREGEVRAWWPDGTLQEVSTYVNDVLEGVSSRWFTDGQQASIFTYLHGREEGAQQMWYEDGTLRANYIVIDGRRYGSNGTKGCTSEVADDA